MTEKSCFHDKVRACFLMLVLLPLSAASAGLTEWLSDEVTHKDIQTLCEAQAIIQYHDKGGRFVSMGMATPISDSELRTAAHVISGATPGDEILVAPCGALRSQLGWSKGRVQEIDLEMDVAIIYLVQDRIPAERIPQACDTFPALLSPVLTLKAITDGVMVESHNAVQAMVTSLIVMPPLLPDIDKHVGNGNHSLVAQVGRPRIVAAGTSVPGASGGAIWDVRRRCVAGVTSAGIEFKFLANREETLRQAGDPPYNSFLVGAPTVKGR